MCYLGASVYVHTRHMKAPDRHMTKKRLNSRIPAKDYNQLKQRAKRAMRNITEQVVFELRREQQLEGVPLENIQVVKQHVFDVRMPENDTPSTQGNGD